MATKADVVDHLLEQTAAAGAMTAKKTFGEYGLFCDGTLVGLVCDDRFYLKPTAAGLALIGEPEQAAPYPGGKPSYVVGEDMWADRAWLSRLVRAAADELPAPKAKTRPP